MKTKQKTTNRTNKLNGMKCKTKQKQGTKQTQKNPTNLKTKNNKKQN